MLLLIPAFLHSQECGAGGVHVLPSPGLGSRAVYTLGEFLTRMLFTGGLQISIARLILRVVTK